MIDLSGLGQRLRETRRDRNLRLLDVTRLCGISKTLLVNYENGKQCPSLPTLTKLLNLYGVGPEIVWLGGSESVETERELTLAGLISQMMQKGREAGNYSLHHKGRKYLTSIQTEGREVILTACLCDGRFPQKRKMLVEYFARRGSGQVLDMITYLQSQVKGAHQEWSQTHGHSNPVIYLRNHGGYAELQLDNQTVKVERSVIPALAEHYQNRGFIIYFEGFDDYD